MRSNVEFDSPEEYYRRSIYIPFLDGSLQELQVCFQGKAKDCVKIMFLIPSHLQSFDAEANSEKNFYSSDLPSRVEFDQEV